MLYGYIFRPSSYLHFKIVQNLLKSTFNSNANNNQTIKHIFGIHFDIISRKQLRFIINTQLGHYGNERWNMLSMSQQLFIYLFSLYSILIHTIYIKPGCDKFITNILQSQSSIRRIMLSH